MRQADVFRAFLTNIVRGNQKTTTDVVPQDITDRLQKLWELKEAGALSDDEFAAQKARLLSPG